MYICIIIYIHIGIVRTVYVCICAFSCRNIKICTYTNIIHRHIRTPQTMQLISGWKKGHRLCWFLADSVPRGRSGEGSHGMLWETTCHGICWFTPWHHQSSCSSARMGVWKYTPINNYIPSLKLAEHLKIGHPKRKLVFQPSIFRGELLVSGRVTVIDYRRWKRMEKRG